MGIKVANLVAERGDLVGALIVNDDDEVMVIMQSGKVQRSRVDEVPRTGRNTQGVIFTRPAKGDAVLAVALNNEKTDDSESDEAQSEELNQAVSALETETSEL